MNPQDNNPATPAPVPEPETVTPPVVEAAPTATPAPEAEPVVAPITPTTPEVPAPKKKLPKWALILIIVVGVLLVLSVVGVIILLVVVGGALAKPLNVSNQFVDAVQANDASAAYVLTTDGFKEATTEESLATSVERISPLLVGSETVTGQNVEAVNGTNQASFSYSVVNDGETRYMLVELKETDGEWKVNSFQSDDEPLSATE